MTGAELIAQWLRTHGVTHLFGLPGSQNAVLYNALRREERQAGSQAWISTHEMSAGFTALGYAAARGAPAVLSIIGGPGFSYALTPLLEAASDSLPLVCLVFVRRERPGKRFQGQAIDHLALGSAAAKAVLTMTHSEADSSSPLAVLDRAWHLAQTGQPGPVVVLAEAEFLESDVGPPESFGSEPLMSAAAAEGPPTVDLVVDRLLHELAAPGRKLFWLGRGTLGAADTFQLLAERYDAVVITTTSARGVMAEDHPRCLPHDLVPADVVNPFLAEFDHIFAWGVRMSENACKGFELRLPREKLIHLDAEPMALDGNYPARFTACVDVAEIARRLIDSPAGRNQHGRSSSLSGMAGGEALVSWRARFASSHASRLEPRVPGVTPPTPAGFFRALREVLPDEAILVLDSGFHQLLARRYFCVRRPRGLLLPANFQSMGFAIGAATGAKLACPDRHVVALLGDGGFRMSGLELLAAVERRISLVTVIFDDGYYGLIRNRQIFVDGQTHGVALPPICYGSFAQAIGANFVDGSSAPAEAIGEALASELPTIVAVRLNDTPAYRIAQYKARARFRLGQMAGPQLLRWLRRRLRP